MKSLIGIMAVLLGMIFVPAIESSSCEAAQQEVLRLTAENQAIQQQLDNCTTALQQLQTCYEQLNTCNNKVTNLTSQLTTCQGELLSFTFIKPRVQECAAINEDRVSCLSQFCTYGCYATELENAYNF